MKTYEGVNYEQIKPGVWRVRFPSGFKGNLEAETEEQLKQKIDGLKQSIAQGGGE